MSRGRLPCPSVKIYCEHIQVSTLYTYRFFSCILIICGCSVLEVRTNIVASALFTLEALLDQRVNSCPSTPSTSHGHRLLIFTSFLSELWDNETLYIFLYTRHTMQNLFRFQFRDACMFRAHPISLSTGFSSSKAPPLSSHSFILLEDSSLSNTPLVAICSSQILSLLQALFGPSNASLSEYIRQQITGNDDQVQIPLHFLLLMFSKQWVELPFSIKNTLNKVSTKSATFTKLNAIYDDNCRQLQELRSAIQVCTLAVSSHDAEIIKVEGAVRRLERSWAEGQLRDLDELRSSRVDITRLTTERFDSPFCNF